MIACGFSRPGMRREVRMLVVMRQDATAGEIEPAIRLDESRRGTTYVRMAVHPGDHPCERIRRENSVRVQKE